jgi:diguanylate cyclase (GGDEF)-like protein/PAS domain S-box-containing protein
VWCPLCFFLAAVPSLVIVAVVAQFATLLLFGVQVATVVAAGATLALWLTVAERPATLRVALETVIAVAATQAAGAVYGLLANPATETWPAYAFPVGIAVVAYSAVAGVASECVLPLVTRQRVNPAWLKEVLARFEVFVIAGAVAVGLVELVQQRMWETLAIAAIPMFLAYRRHADQSHAALQDQRRREVLESLDEGMAVVDRRGRITLWNDTLERLLGVTRDRAVGLELSVAVPGVAKTDLARVVTEVLGGQTPLTVVHITLPGTPNARALQVKVVPVRDGATLLWQDVSARRRTEEGLRRSEERLTLAADGAGDGLWEWDLNAKELYCSGRWRAQIGLPATAAVGRPEEWLARVHPEDIAALKEALEAHLSGKTECFEHEHRIKHEDGSYRWFLCRGIAARQPNRKSARIGGSLTDTTDQARAQEQARSAGVMDSLTGLCNRAVFVENLGRRLEESKQGRGAGRFALLYLDLDRFKVVNDSLGHLVGDELLVAASRRLEGCVRPGDSLARLGGDEFALLIGGLADDQQANAMAFRIQEALRAPFNIGGREVFTSASIGIAFGPAQYTDPDAIMRDADTAMYHAKSRGKARHELFDADMHARVRDRLGLENDLRHAVSSNNFAVHYQPIVSLASGMCIGFESLVRWTRNGEPVSPATFIPMAEELGLIEPLGTWVMQEACRTFADWQRRFPDSGLDCITVNVSSRQLMQQNFLRIVERAVDKAGLNPSDLRIEITETALLDSPATAAELLRELRDFGVKIYLDDFGTGYSSLSHLHKLPVDALKIDRSFVKSLLLPDRPAIVESVLALARTLNTSVVAEGIETDRQARELERLGCTHAQGFLFSRPLSQQAAEEVISSNQPLGPKRVVAETASRDVDLLVPAGPFEWPSHIPVR